MATQPLNTSGQSKSTLSAKATGPMTPADVIVEATALITVKVASLKGKKEMEIWVEVQQYVWEQLVSLQFKSVECS